MRHRIWGLLAILFLLMGGGTVSAKDSLLTNQQLLTGSYLESGNGTFRFYFQGDGNLVLSNHQTSQVLWASDTHGKGGTRLVLQGDGNLVLYTSSSSAVWSTQTHGKGATKLIMQNDGNLVLYTSSNAPVWSTGTAGGVGGGTTADSVDATTLNNKIMAGYQGWFMTSGDGSGAGWRHWAPRTTPNASNITFEMWPDLREYGSNELTNTSFKYANGSNAGLYSAYNQTTVDRHVKWMRDYGIDGVFVQRFIGEAIGMRSVRDKVLQNVRLGSEKYGRVFANMYDISGGSSSTLVNNIKSDWMHLVDNLKITQSSRYLRHNGRPVLSIWGFGFSDRPGNAAQLRELIQWFKSGAPEKYRATIKLGVDPNWRNHSSEWQAAYRSAAIISPWSVGRYSNDSGVDSWRGNKIAPDLSALRNTGIAYMPVVWPGFSWWNLKDGASPFNQIPRRGGRFFWRQTYNAIAAGSRMVYVAMFDEVDEGTAMFKIAENSSQTPTTGRFLTLNADGENLPSDWYLRLMGEATRMLRGQRPMTSVMPSNPIDDK